MSVPSVEQNEQIEGILEALDRGVRADAQNRRRIQRLNVRLTLQAIVIGTSGGAPLRIHSRNLSRSGIGFVSRRLFRRGERLVIVLRVPGHAGKLLLAEVTFCRYVRRALYESGARFIEAVPETPTEGIPAHWTAAATAGN
ncbi:MAG TPA: PilZ domain-containing protein [Phycisphaerae bacterium]|nr:PilZ domain-containing protein [Phycisphaerae bacterium]